MKLFDKFQSFATCSHNRGNTVLFWSDIWVDQAMKDKFLQLFSFTRKPKCSVRFFLSQQSDRIFSPLSQIAATQLEEVQQILQTRNLDESINDTWSYSWGSPKYSSKKAYGMLIGTTPASPLFKWLWASSNLGNNIFFFWLLLRDRLNSRNLLRRKNMDLEDYSCVLCNFGCEETCFHLFFECPFSRDCWATIPINWNLNLSPLDMILQARADFDSTIFREIIITACWVIWNTRNKIIFDNGQKNADQWKRQFRDELGLVCTKAKGSRSTLLSAWRDNYL